MLPGEYPPLDDPPQTEPVDGCGTNVGAVGAAATFTWPVSPPTCTLGSETLMDAFSVGALGVNTDFAAGTDPMMFSARSPGIDMPGLSVNRVFTAGRSGTANELDRGPLVFAGDGTS